MKKGALSMKSSRFAFSGPVIVYLTTAVCLLTLYLMLDGSDITESSRAFLRVSGRMGMGLFFISFGASVLHRIFKADWTAYLIRNRRYYGISTAIVLWVHFLVILSLSVTAPAWFEVSVPWFILFPGSVTFILVGLMALTSNNFAVKKLGSKAWKRLHLVGGYLALSSFIGEYVLVLYLQPFLLPDYEFAVKNSTVLVYSLFSVPLLLLYLRLSKRKTALPSAKKGTQ
jgi:DMSO/TMAO reductase YedYZ heme-binding membrane subunit